MSCDILVQKCFQRNKRQCIQVNYLKYQRQEDLNKIKQAIFFYFHRQHLRKQCNSRNLSSLRLYDFCMHLGSAKIKTKTIKIPSLGIFNVTECQ